MNDITALVSVQKSANLHRLSMLIAYAPSDELRQMAIEVEQYTDRLLGALENYKSREERVTKLVLDNSVSWEELFKQLEEAKQRIVELECMESALRPVGVMSQAAYHRLENRESRFIALWPRPEIYLPRKRPDDGVIVYVRTAGIQVIEGEQKNG